MLAASAWILQRGPNELSTGALVALGVFALAIALLAARGLVDWLFGSDPERATYRLVDEDDRLVLVDAEEADDRRLVGLEPADMRALLDRAEERNEIRLHVVLDREGRREEWERWRAAADAPTPAGVVLEDSKGMVEVHDTGRIEATPPLDDAVRQDLLDVLRAVLGEELHERG
jgi:hypothetical protein